MWMYRTINQNDKHSFRKPVIIYGFEPNGSKSEIYCVNKNFKFKSSMILEIFLFLKNIIQN